MFLKPLRRWRRPIGLAVLAAAVIGAGLAFQPVRALAGQFLGLFRVQQVTVLPIDTTGLQALAGDKPLTGQLSRMMSSAARVVREPGAPQEVATAAKASQAAGFTVRLPGDRSDLSRLTVQGGGAFEFTLERQLALEVLQELGRTDLALPASLEGATVSVDIPAGVSAAYGDCPPAAAEESSGRHYLHCLILAQSPSPTVTTPPDLDVAELAVLGLQLTGMTAEQAREYSRTVDWTSTLVIPVPRNGSEYGPVAVDGVTGYLIQRPSGDAPQFAVVWVRAGILYAVGGLGDQVEAGLALANSLR